MKHKRESKELTYFFKKTTTGSKKFKKAEPPKKDISKYSKELEEIAQRNHKEKHEILFLARAMWNSEILPIWAKYAPKQDVELMDISAKDEIRNYLQFFLDKNQEDTLVILSETLPQAIILYGPHGSGKSSLVKCIANILGFKILESNASQCRNSSSILNLMKEASQNQVVQSHFWKGSLIFIEDIDIVLEPDKGFYKALSNLVKNSRNPVILTATKIPQEFSRDKYKKIEIKRPEIEEIQLRLEIINVFEKLEIEADDIRFLIYIADRDLNWIFSSLDVKPLWFGLGLTFPVKPYSDLELNEKYITVSCSIPSRPIIPSFEYLYLNSSEIELDMDMHSEYLSALEYNCIDILNDFFYQKSKIDSLVSIPKLSPENDIFSIN